MVMKGKAGQGANEQHDQYNYSNANVTLIAGF